MSTPLKNTPFTREELNARQAADLKSELFTPDVIYLELRLLKDYTIGALLALAAEKDADEGERLFASIKKRLIGYDMRVIDDVAEFFPDFGLTTDEIEAVIADPQYTDRILMYAPGTQFIVALIENLRINVNHSEVDDRFEKVRLDERGHYLKNWRDVTYVVNTWPLPSPTGRSLHMIQEFMARTFQSNVIVISHDPKTLESKYYTTCDEFNFYQIGRHFENPNFADPTIRLGFANKSVFSSMVFERSKLNPDEYGEKRFRSEIDYLKAQNNLLFRVFTWINTAYLTVDIRPYLPLAQEYDKAARYEPLPGLNDHVKK